MRHGTGPGEDERVSMQSMKMEDGGLGQRPKEAPVAFVVVLTSRGYTGGLLHEIRRKYGWQTTHQAGTA